MLTASMHMEGENEGDGVHVLSIGGICVSDGRKELLVGVEQSGFSSQTCDGYARSQTSRSSPTSWWSPASMQARCQMQHQERMPLTI
eukprot:89934-Rhodomonas_salina.1